MTIQEFLAEQGLSTEEISAIVGNPAQAKAMTAAMSRYEQALAKETETATYWTEKTQEIQQGVNRLTAAERRAAAAEAEAARVKAYNKSLKDQGYDVPDDMVGGEVKPAAPQYITREDFDKGVRSTAPDLVSLTALSNEYYHLFGQPYIAVEEDFNAARQSGKSLRDYARSKYNFEGKKTEIAQKADQERIDKIVAERLQAKETELAAKYGSNPELRSPLPSKFDKLQKQPGFKEDSWKSREGRNANRQERLKRFENISIN